MPVSQRILPPLLFALIVHIPVTAISVHAQRTPVIRRFHADSFYTRQWVRGGSKEPDLLVEPRALAVTEHAVIVLDPGTREVHGFDLKSGAKRFVLKATGEGPGEFKRPMHIAASAHLVGVLDAATSRFTVYSDSGRFLWTTQVPDGPVVETMCLLPRGVLRVKYLGAIRAIATIDSSGKTLSRTSLPVATALGKAPSFANSAYIADGCAGETMAVAPFFGDSWYSITANGASRRFPYVEAGAEAVVVTKQRRLERTAKQVTTQTTMTTDVHGHRHNRSPSTVNDQDRLHHMDRPHHRHRGQDPGDAGARSLGHHTTHGRRHPRPGGPGRRTDPGPGRRGGPAGRDDR